MSAGLSLFELLRDCFAFSLMSFFFLLVKEVALDIQLVRRDVSSRAGSELTSNDGERTRR